MKNPQPFKEGYRLAYFNTAKLFARLRMAKAEGAYLKEISRLERQHLLVLDDFGQQALDGLKRLALQEIIGDSMKKIRRKQQDRLVENTD